jgi:two-component system chemotaxis response regulator CheB
MARGSHAPYPSGEPIDREPRIIQRPKLPWVTQRIAQDYWSTDDKIRSRAATMKAKIFGKNFPLVCVGGSAGGLDAYTRLLQHLPADMGVAIVIVNHLRTVATLLHEILPRYTAMPVELITERLLIQPNRVFIIPAQRDLHVLDGEFRLRPISKPRGWPDVITVFLHSLTKHWDGKLIAVIVSGYDGDGAAALCGIREVGGITIAQKLDTAGQPDMPRSAIATGCIDFVLSPEEIAREIVRIGHEVSRADWG